MFPWSNLDPLARPQPLQRARKFRKGPLPRNFTSEYLKLQVEQVVLVQSTSNKHRRGRQPEQTLMLKSSWLLCFEY